MKMEYEVKIEDAEFVLLLEINERVKDLIWKVGKNDEEISPSEIEGLKIDKDSIYNITRKPNSKREALANNLTKKIDYIIKKQEESS